MNNADLGLVALGYAPVIDRQRVVVATRLTLWPLRPDAAVAAGPLLASLGAVWPADRGSVWLNVVGEPLLRDLLAAQPATNLMPEVPAFMAGDDSLADALVVLRRNGSRLVLKGRSLRALPVPVRPCFAHAIADQGEDATADVLAASGLPATLPWSRAGVDSPQAMEQAFRDGASTVLGWPIEPPVMQAVEHAGAKSDFQHIVELMRRVDAAEPIDRLEAVLKLDPALAFKLMRYINSPAFGLSVEVSSFRHALMMLGYQRLKRWLALLLVSASRDRETKPAMYAAVRRGLFMEEIARGLAEGDDTMRGEAFICGVFSLLDRMMKRPLAELLQTIPVPESVRCALVDGTGPYQPYLEVVQAVEQGSMFELREQAERMMVSVGDINRALLRALAAAQQLD